MDIADIRIEGDQVNRGYGSIMMEGLMKLVQEMKIKVITGWISSVDWDHIDRSEYFTGNMVLTVNLIMRIMEVPLFG